MKAKIHPTYNSEITVTCSCGNTFTTGSTETSISVEVCSACHPFYTGKSKMIDTAGRVDKFQHRLKETEAKQKKSADRATKKKASKTKEKTVKIG